MKRTGIAHAQLSAAIARLGHTDRVVVGDHGLPIPTGIEVVDLALIGGVIDLRTVLDALLGELVVEAHTVATESGDRSGPGGGAMMTWLDARADRLGTRNLLSHEQFKAAMPGATVAIRTGEQTPYANVMLHCGVPF